MCRILGVLLVCSFLYVCSDCAALPHPLLHHCKKPEWFQCDNGECISFLLECDGDYDCDDGSDERNCLTFQLELPSFIHCARNEYKCEHRDCIPVEKFCDAVPDCADGSDEYDGCVKKLNCDGRFRCRDQHCVTKEWVCDGVRDCPDGSDEWNCDNRTLSPDNCKHENDRYLCDNRRCIALDRACDKKDHCGDGSDEGANCEKNILCTSAGCSHGCKMTPGGPACVCPAGHQLLQDNRTCTDIDECAIYGKCDQRCENTVGSYECRCQRGYELQDDMRTCKATGGEATMVFSVKSEIRAMYLSSQMYFIVANNLSHAVGVTVDGDYTYWSEVEEGSEAIVKSTITGEKNEVIVTTGLHTISDLAVDWITSNIYFTDDGYMRIGVCNNNGTYCTVLINEQTNKPRGLALLPTKGLMYWCDWGVSPHIAMAGMDGKNNSLFVTKNLVWPNSVAIDYPNNRLYWIDAKLAIIESIRLDGSDRRTILHEVAKHPFSLAVFENKLYWSDWGTDTIQSCEKFTGKDWKILVRTSNTPYAVHIDHSAMKPMARNPCRSNPCSQLCLLNRDKGYTCACTLDKELYSDMHSCRDVKKRQHIMIVTDGTFIDYYHELLGRPKITASLISADITAVAYDSLSGTVLASDQFKNNIFRYDPINGGIKNIAYVRNEILGGMEFDHLGNNLYLSDTREKAIEVRSLTTGARTIFYFEEQPYDIALVPEEGVMFVVFRDKTNNYHIDKMQMNGIGARTRFVESDLLGPTVSLCYDSEQRTIFWSDQGSGKIESAAITGFNRYLFRSGLQEPVSIAIAGEYIFWIQRYSNQLFWADKNNILQRNNGFVFRAFESTGSSHLIALHGVIVHEEYGCRKNNGNCSHVCLSSSATSYICACPPGMMLSADNHTCSPQSACPSGEIKCSEHDVCIKRQQWCNGIKECPNGEDEQHDCGETCKKDQFMCKNGQCISSKARCNSYYDCADKSDEEDCNKKECQTNEIRCHDGICISNFLVCNGHFDCLDLSDELNCGTRTCSSDTFMCSTGRCIPSYWECDGEPDCSDGSDETEKCAEASACGDGMFKCANDRCISSSLKCDGVNNCGDESDERYCSNHEHGHFDNCTDDEYLCYNTDICLSKRVRCNGVQDCPKNDDEHNCAYCLENEFVCDNQKCIPQSWVCDKVDDCGDKSDEKECGSNNNRSNMNVNASIECEEFRCSAGSCLPFSKVCDGIPDCPDNSDERGRCTTSCAQENSCKGLCHRTPLGGVCGCREGYRLAADMVSCEDVNECEHDVCSQICRNTVGSYECSCYDGYVIRSDRVSCKIIGPPMELITATNQDIRKMSSNLRSIEVIHPLAGLRVTGLDVNANDDSVYWSCDELGIISKLNIKTKESKIATGVGSPEALAVDRVTDNIYFSDNNHPNVIKVCNLEQLKCATVVKIEGTAKVASLVVDPKNRWLFWSQTTWQVYSNPFSEICRTNMMGSDMKTIDFRNIGVVSGMAIDHAKSKLYWTDSFHKVIESSNLDGSQRSIFLKTDMHQPLGISIFESSLYWLMGLNGHLQKCKLYGEKSCETIDVGTGNINKHFAILDTSKHQLAENLCKEQKCEHMCILRDNGTVCICQDGKPIESNSSVCTENADKVVFASRSITVKAKNIRQYSSLNGLLIIFVIIIMLLTGYCYYQRSKLKMSKPSNSSIHFQNPSYDRRDEVAATFESVASNLSPGEHEYLNPINDDLLKEHTTKKPEMKMSSQTEKEIEIEKDTSLISFIRLK